MSMYGLVLRSDPDAAVQEWVATSDPDDVLKPDSMFIGCDKFTDGVDILAKRYPVPPALAEAMAGKKVTIETVRVDQFNDVNAGGQSRKKATVYPQAVITEVTHYSLGSGGSDLAAGLVATGGGCVIGVSYADYSFASHHQVVIALRKDPTFRASDLVVRAINKGNDGYEIVRNPKQAKTRRKQAVTKAASRAEKNTRAAEEQALKNAAEKRRAKVIVAAHAACEEMWNAIPAAKQLCQAYSVVGHDWDWSWEKLLTFWKVVAFHEAFTKKGKWRECTSVARMLDALANAGDAFDDKWLGTNRGNYEGLREALAKLEPEVKRLVRKRKRRARLNADETEKTLEPAAV